MGDYEAWYAGRLGMLSGLTKTETVGLPLIRIKAIDLLPSPKYTNGTSAPGMQIMPNLELKVCK